MIKRIIKFIRRIPLFLDACNELEDINDIWKYGMDAAGAKQDRRLAENRNAAADAALRRVQKYEQELQNFCDTCVKFETYGPTFREFKMPQLMAVYNEAPEDYASACVETRTIEGREFRVGIRVDADEIRRIRGVSRGAVGHFVESLGISLAHKIADGIFPRKENS